jgi:hypothetical protein
MAVTAVPTFGKMGTTGTTNAIYESDRIENWASDSKHRWIAEPASRAGPPTLSRLPANGCTSDGRGLVASPGRAGLAWAESVCENGPHVDCP